MYIIVAAITYGPDMTYGFLYYREADKAYIESGDRRNLNCSIYIVKDEFKLEKIIIIKKNP